MGQLGGLMKLRRIWVSQTTPARTPHILWISHERSTSMKSLFTLLIFALGVTLVAQDAHASISLSPGDDILNGSDTVPPGQVNPLSADQVEVLLSNYLGIDVDLTECFKDDVGGVNSGAYADDYNVQWDPDTDPSGGTLSWLGPDTITDALYLGVKDGNNADYYYIFDISSWNGTEDIVLSGFWPDNGAISHLSIFCGGDVPQIPEPGSLVIWGALGIVGLVAARSRFRKQ